MLVCLDVGVVGMDAEVFGCGVGVVDGCGSSGYGC